MAKTILVNCIITFLFVILSFMGLNSIMYSRHMKKFYVNPFLLLWCIFVIITFILLYMCRLYNDIMLEAMDLKNAVKFYYYMNIIGAIICYLSQLSKSTALVTLFNLAQFFETLDYFEIEVDVIHRSVLLVILKTTIFPILFEITLILKQQLYYDDGDDDHDDENKSLLWTIYTLYPLIIANIIPNCLFGIFVACRQFVLTLNRYLNNLEKEANFLQNLEQIFLHKRFYRMQTFCKLADKLDELSEKYYLICCQTLNYMSLCAAPLLASLICNLFGIIAGLFQQYYALADTIINDKRYDYFNALTNGVFLIISFLEIALHSWGANQSIEAVKETGLILKRIKLDYADVRFRQAVENFSFKILVIDFKIQPMGLLNIDLSLLHHVLSAVTSFLLILIQSDLTLRFSLK